MMVPSVGCPEFLTNRAAVGHLQWAVHAQERPTILLVPASELQTYIDQAGRVLQYYGVGLASWESNTGLLGFGASRRAAQAYAESLNGKREEVVLCDVNAVESQDVADGYDTGDEKDGDHSLRAVRGPLKYSAAGMATGIPWYDYEEEKDKLKSRGASKGGATRPIEQVVIVGFRMPYDPSFITSSEDADLTQTLLSQETALHQEAITAATFKHKARIRKVHLGSSYLAGNRYMDQRAQLLQQLDYEDNIQVIYRKKWGNDEKVTGRQMSLRDLARRIARSVNQDYRVIRSLILEKIILEAKRRQLSDTGVKAMEEQEMEEKGHHASGSSGADVSMADILNESVMSEATRIGVDRHFRIGYADGTDHNCSIISIFAAAGVNISRQEAQTYREQLEIPGRGDIDLTRTLARRILGLVTARTGRQYILNTVNEGPRDASDRPTFGTAELTRNGNGTPIYIFFAGTHFSPAQRRT
ncbi:MAG: hypothetical protein AAFQ98_25030 [Bacteroidota bacterium]